MAAAPSHLAGLLIAVRGIPVAPDTAGPVPPHLDAAAHEPRLCRHASSLTPSGGDFSFPPPHADHATDSAPMAPPPGDPP